MLGLNGQSTEVTTPIEWQIRDRKNLSKAPCVRLQDSRLPAHRSIRRDRLKLHDSFAAYITIHMDGKEMVVRVQELRPKAGEVTEKITINLGVVDLGQIDLLVQEGFYSNRTDLIRTAIRNQLATHAEVVRETVARKTYVLGLQHFSRRDLEAVQASGRQLQIQVLGLASIADDVPPELARVTIDSIVVLGALHASPAVKAALADRIR